MRINRFLSVGFFGIFLFFSIHFSAKASVQEGVSAADMVYQSVTHSFSVKIPSAIQKMLTTPQAISMGSREAIQLSLSLSFINQNADYQCSVFINHPTADGNTPNSDPHYVNQFQFSAHHQQQLKHLFNTSKVKLNLHPTLMRLKKSGKLIGPHHLSITLVMVETKPSDPKIPPKTVNMMINAAYLSVAKDQENVVASQPNLVDSGSVMKEIL